MVCLQNLPVAPSVPLLEAVGEGKLRVRFAAPSAEPACTTITVCLRTVGSKVWSVVCNNTKRLVKEKGHSVPARAGEVVVQDLAAGAWEACVRAHNAVGWGVKSPVSVHVSVTAGDDDDDGSTLSLILIPYSKVVPYGMP